MNVVEEEVIFFGNFLKIFFKNKFMYARIFSADKKSLKK